MVIRAIRPCTSLCLLSAAVTTARAEPVLRRPNFIFAITDDQRWDAMGVVQKEQGDRARFPWFESPAMDRLADEGVRFRNAFVTLSLCAPSRASFLTGQYAHRNGIKKNQRRLSPEAATHASLMRASGYRTAYIGKWHLGGKDGERPGFDYAASYLGQGVYQDCTFFVNGEETPTKGWVDDVSTTFAIEWIRKNHDKPFSLVLGFKSAHNQRGGESLPPRLRDLYEGRKSRPVPNITSDAIFHQREPGGALKPHRFVENHHHLDYLRHLKGVDENLGRLLDALDESDLADDTVVVFTSDNGYFLGEHNCGDKRALYEESIRIPMLVRYPRLFKPGQVVDSLVLNVDLAPTFLDLAGLPVPAYMQGRSWKPLASGDKVEDWRTSFVAHYYKELGDTPTCVALRTETEKLVLYPGHPQWTEVFNLETDPYETKNLVSDEALRSKLTGRLKQEMKAIGLTMSGTAGLK